MNVAILEKKSYWTQNMIFYFLYNFCLQHFLFKEDLSETWSNTSCGLHAKYPLFLSDFTESWIFITFFSSKSVQIRNFMEISPVGAELFHADRRTDMKKLLVAFRNFANAPNKTCVAAVHRVCSITGNLYSQTITGPKWRWRYYNS